MEASLISPDYTHDLLIIGGACAGLAAGTYAARRNLKTLIITKDVGGQIATTPSVENYPGIDFIGGPALASSMMQQAIKWGCEVAFDEVVTITKVAEKLFTVTTKQTSYTAKAVIAAYGKTPRSLGVPGEMEYAGRGVSYCVTCDAPLFKKKTVAVVGGGNSAMEGALILAETSEKVYLIHRRNEFRGEAVLLDRIAKCSNIEQVLSVVPQSISGDGLGVTALHVADVANPSEKREIAVDGIFVEIGFLVNTALIAEYVDIDSYNQVITDKYMTTRTPGLLAAGDLTDSPYKQAVISAGEGAAAALSAYTYIHDGKSAGVDWGK
jgi:thioredoxin reductase (NADPH)